MVYVEPDYKSKKLFKEAIKAGVEHITYNPSGLFPVKLNGTDVVEGPHYPKPHSWYAQVEVKDGKVVRVIA